MFEPREKELLQEAFAQYHRALAAVLPGEEELRSVTISEKTERRMQRLFYHQKHFYYHWINTAAKRVACILVALFLAATTATVSVEALREGFVRFIVETFEKGSTVWFSKEDANTPTVPTVTPKIPAYFPEGYHLVADMSDDLQVYQIYERNEAESIMFKQLPKGSKTTVNTEGVAYRKIYVANLHEGIVFQNKGETFLLFNDGDYLYVIIGTVTEEEVLKIACSIPF